jgi:hypothetical protein
MDTEVLSLEPAVRGGPLKHQQPSAQGSCSFMPEPRCHEQVPGPGEYDTSTRWLPPSASTTASSQPATAGDPTVAQTSSTSSFATKVLRDSQRIIPPSRAAPGPGEYFSRYQDAIRAGKATPKQHQFFSSTQRRNYEVDQLKLLSAPTYVKTPGPGTYMASSSFGSQPFADPSCSAFSTSQVQPWGLCSR